MYEIEIEKRHLIIMPDGSEWYDSDLKKLFKEILEMGYSIDEFDNCTYYELNCTKKRIFVDLKIETFN